MLKYFVKEKLNRIKTINSVPMVISPLFLILLRGYTEAGPDVGNTARCPTKEFPGISSSLSFFQDT